MVTAALSNVINNSAAVLLLVHAVVRARDELKPALVPFPPDDLRREVFTLFKEHTELQSVRLEACSAKDGAVWLRGQVPR